MHFSLAVCINCGELELSMAMVQWQMTQLCDLCTGHSLGKNKTALAVSLEGECYKEQHSESIALFFLLFLQLTVRWSIENAITSMLCFVWFLLTLKQTSQSDREMDVPVWPEQSLCHFLFFPSVHFSQLRELFQPDTYCTDSGSHFPGNPNVRTEQQSQVNIIRIGTKVNSFILNLKKER